MTEVIHIDVNHEDAETQLYKGVHREVRKVVGKLTPAAINGILFQVKLELLDVFCTDDEGYTT